MGAVADRYGVMPEQVLGPPRPGLAVAYCTDTRPCAAAVELARGDQAGRGRPGRQRAVEGRPLVRVLAVAQILPLLQPDRELRREERALA